MGLFRQFLKRFIWTIASTLFLPWNYIASTLLFALGKESLEDRSIHCPVLCLWSLAPFGKEKGTCTLELCNVPNPKPMCLTSSIKHRRSGYFILNLRFNRNNQHQLPFKKETIKHPRSKQFFQLNDFIFHQILVIFTEIIT